MLRLYFMLRNFTLNHSLNELLNITSILSKKIIIQVNSIKFDFRFDAQR